MKPLVLDLCSEACAGRAPGTEQSRAARRAITTELRRAGLDPFEQAVPGCNGANVLAVLPGDVDRWVVLGAHYDHLGKIAQVHVPSRVDGGTILDYTHRVTNRRRDLLRSVSALLFAGLLTGCAPSIQQRACTADCQRTNDNCLLAATTSGAVASCDRLIDSCRAKCPG